MSYYVLSLYDWDYDLPYWFRCDCSKEAFSRAIKESIDYAIYFCLEVEKTENFIIGGGEILGHIIRHLQEFYEYELVEPDHKVLINDAICYDEDEVRPEMFSEKSWEKLIKHNKEILDRLEQEDI